MDSQVVECLAAIYLAFTSAMPQFYGSSPLCIRHLPERATSFLSLSLGNPLRQSPDQTHTHRHVTITPHIHSIKTEILFLPSSFFEQFCASGCQPLFRSIVSSRRGQIYTCCFSFLPPPSLYSNLFGCVSVACSSALLFFFLPLDSLSSLSISMDMNKSN